MTTIRKASYAVAIPEGAKIVEQDGQRFARFKRKNRQVDALVIGNGSKCRIESDCWYVRYKDVDGKWKDEKGYSDLRATEKLAERIQERLDRQQEGMPDQDHFKRPLSEHLKEFSASLKQKTCEKNRKQVIARLEKVFEECGFQKLAEIQALRVQQCLDDMRDNGTSIQTINHYVASVKQFCNWLVKHGRLPASPVALLDKSNAEVDRRRLRRAMSADEIRRILIAARDSVAVFRGLSGADRLMLYCTAFGTGFRASELASLTPESFDLDSDPPTVTVEAKYSKRRRRDEQPLPQDLADALRAYLADKLAQLRQHGRRRRGSCHI